MSTLLYKSTIESIDISYLFMKTRAKLPDYRIKKYPYYPDLYPY
ncbi:hypothetical protein PORCAN_1081 [Porphyromonas crevioricanis JCM 13913]|nr:hypothetical protein PORCAN_1081 [Porphyromonas crevioricanis JCM 13913]